MAGSSDEEVRKKVGRRDFLRFIAPATGAAALGIAGGLGYLLESQISNLQTQGTSVQAQSTNLLAQSTNLESRTSRLESLSKVEPYSYIIFSDNRNYYAKNGQTGSIDEKDTSLVSVLNYARDNLTTGRSWRERISLKGNLTLDGKFSLSDHTELDLSVASITVANGFNDDMIDATGTNFAILGGQLDGTGQTSGNAIRISPGAQRFWVGYGMRILHAKGDGIHVEGTLSNPVGVGTIADIDIEKSGNNGILLGPFSADNIASRINCGTNGNFGAGTGSGILMNSTSDNIVSDIIVWGNAAQGLDIFASPNNGFSNIRANSNGAHGIRLGGGSNSNVLLVLKCHDNGSLAPGTLYSGVKIEGSNDNVLLGGRCQNATSLLEPLGPFQAYGIDESGMSDFNKIEAINVRTNKQLGITRVGLNTHIFNCPGFNPQGAMSVPAIGPSPFTYTNRDSVSEAIYVRGGSVSDISRLPPAPSTAPPTTIFTGTPATVWLDPGESVVVTYSTAPTMIKDMK